MQRTESRTRPAISKQVQARNIIEATLEARRAALETVRAVAPDNVRLVILLAALVRAQEQERVLGCSYED